MYSRRSTFPDHLIGFDLITVIVLGEMYKLCNSSLCSFLKLPLISSVLGYLYSSEPCFQPSQSTVFPQGERPNFTPIQNNR
jgi:hypothetical protein